MEERISLQLNMKDGTLNFQGSPRDLGEALLHVERFMQQRLPQGRIAEAQSRPPAQIEMFASDDAGVVTPASSVETIVPKPKGKKSKPTFQMDKTLSLKPEGKISAVDFATEKAPSNGERKCLVAVYYLRQIIEIPQISADLVYTFFKTVSWPVPTDLKNKLQKAGSIGWLDTAKSDDIKITPMGENEVEFNLPANKGS